MEINISQDVKTMHGLGVWSRISDLCRGYKENAGGL